MRWPLIGAAWIVLGVFAVPASAQPPPPPHPTSTLSSAADRAAVAPVSAIYLPRVERAAGPTSIPPTPTPSSLLECRDGIGPEPSPGATRTGDTPAPHASPTACATATTPAIVPTPESETSTPIVSATDVATDTPTPIPSDTPTPDPSPSFTPTSTPPVTMSVCFFDVGQGDGAWIHTSDGYDVIVDAGPGATTSGAKIARHLSDSGVEQLDEVHASHPDADHIRGLLTIIDEFEVGRYVHNGATATSETYRKLATAVAANAIPTHVAREGDRFEWGCCVEAHVLHPIEPLRKSAPNNSSIVMKVSHGSVDVLFTGDIEAPAERLIVERYRERSGDIQVEILKVPHHGSNTSSTGDFLNLVDPDVAIISASGARSSMPHPDILSRLLGLGIEVLQTRLSGNIGIVSDGTDFSLTDCAPRTKY